MGSSKSAQINLPCSGAVAGAEPMHCSGGFVPCCHYEPHITANLWRPIKVFGYPNDRCVVKMGTDKSSFCKTFRFKHEDTRSAECLYCVGKGLVYTITLNTETPHCQK